MNEYTINDEYGYNEYDYLCKVIDNCLRCMKVQHCIFSITFIDDKKMKELNFRYRGIDKTTDVLSFAFEDDDNICYNEYRLLGEIFISIDQMIKQAANEKKELSLLVVHGILHLLGYDHETIEKEKEMFSLQEMVLNGTKEI